MRGPVVTMRNFFSALALLTLVLGLTLGIAGCFNPDKPSCSFVCAAADPKCPDSYECRADNYCHLVGTTDSCGFSDAAVGPQDLSATPSDLPPAPADGAHRD